ncbi:hypothetical protein L917_01280 [Phytophthora nicotianae]|uniref:Uncharacterized protein n=1 Tax=Phytophthora nicotianae TaxID=4792 RepID=W2P3T1_PHYNI|nr:hypothetical protein L915_01320 [Phytophthora nicotianae]ETL49167.1 hypothetical protein L916_01298 [Phytophthora nicotianae]ETM02211.1 hypothetical protein L917_01280 [Phytophthora nicotianae]ETM55466.1 hypothetical protein L914_01309 [Phytophthora nicotianae]
MNFVHRAGTNAVDLGSGQATLGDSFLHALRICQWCLAENYLRLSALAHLHHW